MADRLGLLFGLAVTTAAATAYLAPPSLWRWAAIGLLGLFGLWCAVFNWRCVVLGILGRKAPSMAPLFGAIVLCLAIGAVPVWPVRKWFGLGLIADPWLVAMLWLSVGTRLRGKSG